MKKLITLFLILALILPAAACAELSDLEQQYVGSWCMYAQSKSGTIYAFMIVFLDNSTVVRNAMVFENGALVSNNKSSSDWIGFSGGSVLLSLAGTDMAANIRDDGNLYLFFLEDMEFCGAYSRCPDMSPCLGWSSK